VVICALFASTYVGSMYIWVLLLPLLNKGEEERILRQLKNRDDPLTMKCRFVSATLSSIFCICLSLSLSTSPLGPTLACMGIRFDFPIIASILPLGLVSILFLGPIALLVFDSESPLDLSEPIFFIRNLLICPITEEIVFRGCIIPILMGSGLSRSFVIFVSPFFFGAAHLHHVFAGVPVISVLFQFGFTTVFGWLSGYIFVRTGSLLSAILVHSFCNMMGFPEFHRVPSHREKNVLIVCFLSGIVFFFFLLGQMTEPSIFSNHVFY